MPPTDTTSPPIEFTVKPDTVQAFAHLTGDVSSLHTDPDFARRSLYGESVAHGMLPVMGLAFCRSLRREGCQARITHLAASFQSPVFLHDRLVISLGPQHGDTASNNWSAPFSIARAGTGAVVTQGTITWQFHPRGAIERARLVTANEVRKESPSLSEPPTERNLTFAEIRRGDRAMLPARIGAIHRARLAELLREATGATRDEGPEPEELAEHVDLGSFLVTSLCSTLVGVCLPGKTATFLGFSLEFVPHTEWPNAIRAESEVTFVSHSTRSIVERFSVFADSEGQASLVTGKLKVRINEPPARMPAISSLAQHLDLGLKDKVVLITGASRGLGETMAKLFALHGSRVVVNYHRGGDDAARVAHEIRSHGLVAFPVQADVADRTQVDAMIAAIGAEFGPVDVLVNNAARKYQPTAFVKLTWETVQSDLDVSVRGAFHCSQAVVPEMIERRRGKIINIGTLATDVPPPRQCGYVIGKSALTGLTRSLAIELAPHNIQVNMVSPGMAETDLTSGVSPLVRDRVVAETPMNRLVTPAEVANAVVVFASSLASFTTGQRFMVTGGMPPYL